MSLWDIKMCFVWQQDSLVKDVLDGQMEGKSFEISEILLAFYK